MQTLKTGSCLCGGVTYEIFGSLRPIVACHCVQCRKTSGHYVAATQCLATDIVIIDSKLKWFKSSANAERGFCGQCGSNLFWRKTESPYVSVFAGTIDGATGLSMESQLYPESKGDYYSLPEVLSVSQDTLR